MRFFLTALFASGSLYATAQLEINFSRWAQTIEHIGSSTGMHGDYIAQHWDIDTVDKIAELLFSPEKGIGLSSFRIQIGGGASGRASGIAEPWRWTDCFLRPDGSYDWDRERGVRYWREKVDEYKLPVVIGYLNSPPVNYCESGYTFKTAKSLRSNLKPGHYADYAEFLAKVAGHFQSLELPFTHISPVNEPQWFWQGVPGKAKQEGSPWTNEQIAKLVRLTDEEFRKGRVVTKLLIPEAADYQALCQPMPGRTFSSASDQINAFWKPGGRDYVGNLQTLDKAVAGHAYFSDGSMDKILRTRRMVKSTVGSLPGLRFWQTEYSLLGDGWTGGLPRDSVDEMTAALLLARNIHADFTLADATAWQWWSSTEPQFGPVSRYCLIACDPQGAEKFRATKLLWALGHYGRFIRPGMVRVETDPDQDLSGLMHSGYINPKTGHWVVVLINFSKQSQTVELKLRNTRRKSRTGYLTNREADMKKFKHNGNEINLPAHSIITLLSD